MERDESLQSDVYYIVRMFESDKLWSLTFGGYASRKSLTAADSGSENAAGPWYVSWHESEEEPEAEGYGCCWTAGIRYSHYYGRIR